MAITLPDIHSAREKYREVGNVYDFALLCHMCRKQMMLARVTPKTLVLTKSPTIAGHATSAKPC